MLKPIENLPAQIDGLDAIGSVSKQDYEDVFVPLVERAGLSGRKLRFLYRFGPDFTGFTTAGAWEDTKLGFRSISRFEGCAIVSDISWVRESARLFGFLMPCPVEVFGTGETHEAVGWLQSLPAVGVAHYLVRDAGVLVVDVQEPLRVADFDALAATADAWLDSHDELPGLVLHARRFPGWENVASFLRHVRFVRDHHRRIARVALAADGTASELAPRLVDHFVTAEVRHFAYDNLDRAIAWAAGEPRPQPAPSSEAEARRGV